MVVRIETHLFEIVVLPGYPQAFLGVRGAAVRTLARPEKHVLELVHPGIREKQRGIPLGRQRIARHDLVPPLPEKIKERAANVVGRKQIGHIRIIQTDAERTQGALRKGFGSRK